MNRSDEFTVTVTTYAADGNPCRVCHGYIGASHTVLTAGHGHVWATVLCDRCRAYIGEAFVRSSYRGEG